MLSATSTDLASCPRCSGRVQLSVGRFARDISGTRFGAFLAHHLAAYQSAEIRAVIRDIRPGLPEPLESAVDGLALDLAERIESGELEERDTAHVLESIVRGAAVLAKGPLALLLIWIPRRWTSSRRSFWRPRSLSTSGPPFEIDCSPRSEAGWPDTGGAGCPPLSGSFCCSVSRPGCRRSSAGRCLGWRFFHPSRAGSAREWKPEGPRRTCGIGVPTPLPHSGGSATRRVRKLHPTKSMVSR